MSDVKFKINTKEVQFETPETLTDRVQNASEAKEMGHLEMELTMTKKQIYRKYKHRFEYKNTDGSPIASKKEFREAQIRLVKEPDTYVSKGVHISTDHDP